MEGANGLKVSGDCHDEHEFDWFSHLHCGGSGKKGDSLLQIHQRVDTLPATLSILVSTILFSSYLCYLTADHEQEGTYFCLESEC